MSRILIYDPYLAEPGGGQKFTIAAAEIASREHDVLLLHPPGCDPARWKDWYGRNLTRVSRREVRRAAEIPLLSREFDLFLNSHNAYWIEGRARRNWLYCHFPIPLRRQFDLRLWIQRRLGLPIPMRRTWVLPLPFHRPNHLSQYEHIFCNSTFTRRWIGRRLGIRAEVFPLFSDFDPPETRKDPIVLHVARIVPEKAALECVRAWRKLEPRTPPSWRLVIAGATHGWSTPDYLRSLRREASGLQIDFRFDLPHDDLRALLTRASIFWHFAGIGQDEERRPQLFEHFGLTAVEAMQSRCAPVLFRGGGLLDVVREPRRDGVLVRTLDEAVRETDRLISDPEALGAMSAAARASSERYSWRSFTERFLSKLSQRDSETPGFP